MSLAGKTVFVTGGSRGIGLAIALRAARDGARVAIAAKTAEPHPKLPGTIYTAAREVEQAGGEALPLVCDVRDEAQIEQAVAVTAARFGGIDICVNNASAIDLSPTEALPTKKLDLIHQINVRGTYLVSRACVRHLRGAANPHVLNLSPPPQLNPTWFAGFPAYALSKYAMSFYALAMAEEFRADGIAFNTLWPRTLIETSAIQNLPGAYHDPGGARTPQIMADAAWLILNRPSRECTGRHFIDEDLLIEAGVTDLRPYRVVPGAGELMLDLFVEPKPRPAGVLC